MPDLNTQVEDHIIVRVEMHSGDDLEEVRIVELDRETIRGLQAYAEVGQCPDHLRDHLIGLMAEALPAIKESIAHLRPELRDTLCAAYAVKFGRPVDVAATFHQQMK